MLNTYAYGNTKYPNPVQEYLRFIWEREQVDVWLRAANGYVRPRCRGMRVARQGFASAAVTGDFVVVDMFGEACAGNRHTEGSCAARSGARQTLLPGLIADNELRHPTGRSAHR